MIKPTIGRVVLVYRGAQHLGRQWNQASVCAVHSDTSIAVSGADRNGEPFVYTSIYLRQDDIASDATDLPEDLIAPDQPFACWMPYQRKVNS